METYFTFIIHRTDIEEFKEGISFFPDNSVEIIGHYGIPTKEPIYEVIELFVNLPNRKNNEIVSFIDRTLPYIVMHQSLSNYIFLGNPEETNNLLKTVYGKAEDGGYFYYDILSTEERYYVCLSALESSDGTDLEALRYDPGSGGYWHRQFTPQDDKLFTSDDCIELEATMTGVVYYIEMHDYVDALDLKFVRLKIYLLL